MTKTEERIMNVCFGIMVGSIALVIAAGSIRFIIWMFSK